MAIPTDTSNPGAPAVWDNRSLDAVHAQHDKAIRVRRMFDNIAPTYERINAIFSFGRDRAWRRELVRAAEVTPGERVLDIACGTGDVVRAFERFSRAGRVVGADFAARMLDRARNRSGPVVSWCRADALQLPFADAVFDVVSCAFGVRNFQDLHRGLCEIHRVLKPGGRLVILEFARPRNGLVRRVHEYYCNAIMPRAANWISRDRTGAYRYLPRSVVSFLDGAGMSVALTKAGFTNARPRPMTLGVVYIHRAEKTAPKGGELR